MAFSKTGPIGIFKKFNAKPSMTAHNEGNNVILLTALFKFPPNFKTKMNESNRKINKVAISQKIALKKPAWPNMPKLIG